MPFDDQQPGTVELLEPEQHVKHESLWMVLLHDDDLHTYEYVVFMLIRIFSMSMDQAFAHACEVDADGVTIVASLPREEAHNKRDAIHSFGGDPLLGTSVSMQASVEPIEG
jgi:ATP-dependent Clp protease adaptor protein ClpS